MQPGAPAPSDAPPTVDEMKGLGANERALLGRIGWEPARRMAVRIVRLKMRLQFTGWLQYLLPVPFILAFGLLGGVSWLLGTPIVAAVFFVPAGLLVAVAAFDIVTTKWKIRFAERRPPRLDDLDVFDLLRARHSCRSFQTRRMTDADRKAVLAAVDEHRAIPMIGETTPRLEYIAAPLTVWPTVNASEFLVAILPKAYDRTAIIDVGRTLQRVVMDVTRMGLATCWIGPGADHESIEAHLGDRFDPNSEHIICVCAVGYRSRYIPTFIRLFNHEMSTRRLPLDQLFFSDESLRHPIDTTASPFARFGRTYEACQWGPSSYNGQTTRAVIETDEAGDVSAVKFVAATASRYYAPVALGIWCANWELGCAALGIAGEFEAVPANDGAPPLHDVTWRPTA
jgi:nitroreductase